MTALSDRQLAEIDRALDDGVMPSPGEVRALVAEVRSARRELVGLRRFLYAVVHVHTLLGGAITQAGEL